MLGKILEVPHAIDMVMGWLACCDAVQEFTVRRPPPLARQDRGAPQRAWHVGLEEGSQGRQGKAPLVDLGEDIHAGEHTQQPMQRLRVYADSRGQFVAAFRPVFQHVGDAELCRHVDRL
jgi:hypothetical protein